MPLFRNSEALTACAKSIICSIVSMPRFGDESTEIMREHLRLPEHSASATTAITSLLSLSRRQSATTFALARLVDNCRCTDLGRCSDCAAGGERAQPQGAGWPQQRGSPEQWDHSEVLDMTSLQHKQV